MTRRFGVVTLTAGALASGTLVLSLAACGSTAAGVSSGTARSSAGHACHPGRSADCAGAHLAGVNHADLSGADLSSANLTGANLRSADLNGADMMRANLKRADLSGGNFMGADLSGAINSNLNSASASSTRYVICHTILPSGRRPVKDC
jgi:hypothetical protein